MNADARRKIEMGHRALEFSQAHPDSEPGTAEAVARLEQLIARANATAATQRSGVIQVRAAAAQKEKLRRAMQVPIEHLAQVGRAAAGEDHELGKTFQFRPGADTYLAFRTAARSMAAAAQEHREVLLKYGLSPSVLDGFVEQLDEFDEALVMGHEGHGAHVGATRELGVVSAGIFRAVRVMNARNLLRFAADAQLLGSWISASTVFGKGRPGTEPEGGAPADGEARPAA